ncbi:tetratricopeptide repeat protein [Kribbella sandramycini]|uniref:Tetratricopeptide repeat protein n=1 Tax=Kribbella sandramycini TaxID=60450 RepID=A0A7Y4NZE7_9ACTN|nr:tetratricopeptide repeat protein [Kribbella sandramycini]NOL40773.1 tetratricopeptide repeat protein [Kribbella sandramycini]
MDEERRGVYPFCGSCTASSVAWRVTGGGGFGGRFYGHRDICEDCGSSVRTLYRTLLWVPLARSGQFRIIPTGGRTYVARKVIDRPTESREPVSAADPGLAADPSYRQAESYWEAKEPGQALPFYQAALERRETELPADDPATLQIRLRVAQGLLATGNYGRAIAWFELVTPQLVRVFGANHELTRAANEGATGARLMVGGPRSEASLLADIVAVDRAELPARDPQLLRDQAALGRALLAGGRIAEAIEALSAALVDAEDALGADHPDTAVYRAALRDTCQVGAARGKKRDLPAIESARRLLNDEAAPTDT